MIKTHTPTYQPFRHTLEEINHALSGEPEPTPLYIKYRFTQCVIDVLQFNMARIADYWKYRFECTMQSNITAVFLRHIGLKKTLE